MAGQHAACNHTWRVRAAPYCGAHAADRYADGFQHACAGPQAKPAASATLGAQWLSTSALRLAHIYAGTGPHLPCTVVITLRIHSDGRPLLLTPAALPSSSRIVRRGSLYCASCLCAMRQGTCSRLQCNASCRNAMQCIVSQCNASCRNAWLALLCRREAR
jgi:hypothetical protein